MTSYRDRRLAGVHTAGEAEPEPEPQPEPEPEPDDDDDGDGLEDLTLTELRERLITADLPTSGNKPELIERLRA